MRDSMTTMDDEVGMDWNGLDWVGGLATEVVWCSTNVADFL
jgi:hypothetical protein